MRKSHPTPVLHKLSLPAVVAAALPAVATAHLAGFTDVTLDPAPTADVTDFSATGLPAFGGGDADPDITTNTMLLSFSTSFGTVDDLIGASAAVNLLTDPLADDVAAGDSGVRNYWGFETTEADGGAALTGLDLGTGTDNLVTADIIFADGVVGAPGAANDLFLTDLFGDDSITVRPLVAREPGTPAAPEFLPLGDLVLEINSGPGGFNFETDDTGDWGDAGLDWAIALDTFPGIADDVNVVGVAFDVEDFVGTTPLPAGGIRGLRVQGTGVNSGRGSIDLGVVGYSAAAVPEPASLALLAAGGLLLARRR